MFQSFDDVQRAGRESLELAGKSVAALSDGLRAFAGDTADYTKKTFETSASSLEKLAGAASLDQAVEVQKEFARSSYRDFVSQSAKLGELFTNLAREGFKPFEGILSRSGKAL